MLRDYMLSAGGWSRADVDAIDAECVSIVDRAVEEATALPEPQPESVEWRLFAD
jgi:TPP-dependent pyruvate/acetoin dehydrogenase alpha subunit